jgi:apoptosis-stimulating of p53 protein 2
LKFLKQQDQRQQQQAAEQEKLKRLKEIAENQEAKLKKVRALKGHVEQKRLSNGKLGKLFPVDTKGYRLSYFGIKKIKVV